MNNESYDFEDRKYINPTLSRDEQLAFVDKFRGIQQQDMNKIARDTHNLGTDVPSIEGGLSGSEGMWANQYVNPRVDSMVSGLQATAQAQALNDVLNNYQSQMKKRYNDAYRAAQLRGNGGGNTGDDDSKEGEVDYSASDEDEKSTIWNDSNYNDNEAFYGLYRLTRNPGESDEDWYARAKSWIKQQSAQHNLRSGNVPKAQDPQWKKDKENGTVTPSGNPLIDVIRFFG